MHAIVMVHKMQRMALSSHQLLPTNAGGAEKADSENTRNSDNNDDDPGEEHTQQGDRGSKLNQLHTNTQPNRIGQHT